MLQLQSCVQDQEGKNKGLKLDSGPTNSKILVKTAGINRAGGAAHQEEVARVHPESAKTGSTGQDHP